MLLYMRPLCYQQKAIALLQHDSRHQELRRSCNSTPKKQLIMVTWSKLLTLIKTYVLCFGISVCWILVYVQSTVILISDGPCSLWTELTWFEVPLSLIFVFSLFLSYSSQARTNSVWKKHSAKALNYMTSILGAVSPSHQLAMAMRICTDSRMPYSWDSIVCI